MSARTLDRYRVSGKLILSAKDRTVGVQGYAGTGKTTMLDRARRLAENKGWRMMGLAPSASAAQTLSAEAGIASETLQRFLARNAGVAEGRLTRRGAREMRSRFAKTILVVDEGSLASTVQARDLLRIATELRIPRVVLVGELQLVRALLEEAGLLETARGGRLRASRRGNEVLAGAKGTLQVVLFRLAFWRLSLNLFGKAECGSWPQQQIGLALWALSTTGDRFQGTRALMVLSVLPDESVSRRPEWVATTLFSWRVLRPLWWFGLVECRERGEDLDGASWRKSALFDRFLGFGTDLARTEGPLH